MDRKIRRETERVVKKVLKVVQGHESIGKEEFGIILSSIVEHVHKNTGVAVKEITQKTRQVLRELPEEYRRSNGDERSREAMITYLYTKYLRELGLL